MAREVRSAQPPIRCHLLDILSANKDTRAMSKTSPTRRAIEKEHSRARILEAATRLFAVQGVDRVSFSDIAEEAGISRTLIYFHFKDRTQLFHETVLRACQLLLACFATAVADKHSGLEQLVAIGRAYRSFFKEHPQEFTLLLQYSGKPLEGSEDKGIAEQIQATEKSRFELLSSAVKRGVKDGSVRDDIGNAVATSLCLWGFSLGLLQLSSVAGDQLSRNFGISNEVLVEHGLSMLEASLRKSKKH